MELATITAVGICPACGTNYEAHEGCSYSVLAFRDKDGEEFTLPAVPVPYDHEGHWCHGCGVAHGQTHHVECDAARCPSCKGQLLCCGGTCDLVEYRIPGEAPVEVDRKADHR